MKKWILTSFVALIVIGLTQVTQIHWVKSKSLGDHKLYLTLKGYPVKVGDIITVYYKTEHLGEAFYTKILTAKEGSSIEVYNNILLIKGLPLGLKDTYKKNGVSYKLDPLEERSVPKGYVFVRGVHPYSYDSRYEGFGLLPVSSIIGRSFVLL